MSYGKDKFETDLTIMRLKRLPSIDVLKFQYRALASQLHPNRNSGNYQKFAELAFSFQRLTFLSLTDPKLTKTELNTLNFSYHHPLKIYKKVYCGKYRNKVPKVHVSAAFTLKELYLGVNYNTKLQYLKICHECRSLRFYQENKLCDDCCGSGYVSFYEKGSVNFFAGQGIECFKCKGDGEYQIKSRGCKLCNGDGLIATTKDFSIDMSPGAYHKMKIYMSLDDVTDYTGDYSLLVFTVLQKQDTRFQRVNNDLYAELHILLRDSILGVDQIFQTCDDRTIRITSPCEYILSNGQKMMVKGEGMPILKHPDTKGDLMLEIQISFPSFEELTKELEDIFKSMISGDNSEESYEIKETLSLTKDPCKTTQK